MLDALVIIGALWAFTVMITSILAMTIGFVWLLILFAIETLRI